MGTSTWKTPQVELTTQWIYLIFLIFFLIFHSSKFYFINKAKRFQKYVKFCKLDVRHISYFVIIFPLLNMLQNVILYTPGLILEESWINDDICTFKLIFSIVVSGMAKLAIHLFVALRCRVSTNRLSKLSVFWYKFGLVVMCINDISFIIYVATPISDIRGKNVGILCDVESTPKALYIWYSAADFLISAYCLFVFILPLRKILTLERKTSSNITTADDHSLNMIVKKILIYSSIAIISTMVCLLISGNFNSAAATLNNLDHVINCYCVVMQFGNVNAEVLPKYLVKPYYILQCVCCWKQVARVPSVSTKIKMRVRSLSKNNDIAVISNDGDDQTKKKSTNRSPKSPHEVGLKDYMEYNNKENMDNIDDAIEIITVQQSKKQIPSLAYNSQSDPSYLRLSSPRTTPNRLRSKLQSTSNIFNHY